jgi:hypothetical protein
VHQGTIPAEQQVSAWLAYEHACMCGCCSFRLVQRAAINQYAQGLCVPGCGVLWVNECQPDVISCQLPQPWPSMPDATSMLVLAKLSFQI